MKKGISQIGSIIMNKIKQEFYTVVRNELMKKKYEFEIPYTKTLIKIKKILDEE